MLRPWVEVEVQGCDLFGMNCFGQQLRLVNEYQTNSFKPNSLYEIVMANGKILKDESLCGYLELIGTLKTVHNDRQPSTKLLSEINNY